MKSFSSLLILLFVSSGCAGATPNGRGVHVPEIKGRVFYVSGAVVGYETPDIPDEGVCVRLRVSEIRGITNFMHYVLVEVGDFWWRDYHRYPPGAAVCMKVVEPASRIPVGRYRLLENVPAPPEDLKTPGLEELTGFRKADVMRQLSIGGGLSVFKMLENIERFGPPVGDVFLAAMESPRMPARLNATIACSFLPKTGYVKTLARLARDENPKIRLAAMMAAREIGDPAAVEALKLGIVDNKDETRLAAYEGVSWLRNKDLLPLLKVGLADPSIEIRATAARGIAMLRTPAAEKALRKRIRTETDDGVRRIIVRNFGMMDSDSSLVTLSSLIRDRDPVLQLAALEAVALRGKAAGPVLVNLIEHEDKFVRWKANAELERIYATETGFDPDAKPEELKKAAARWLEIIKD